MKILITCFDPFGNMEINASRAVLDRIDTYKFDAEIIKPGVWHPKIIKYS